MTKRGKVGGQDEAWFSRGSPTLHGGGIKQIEWRSGRLLVYNDINASVYPLSPYPFSLPHHHKRIPPFSIPSRSMALCLLLPCPLVLCFALISRLSVYSFFLLFASLFFSSSTTTTTTRPSLTLTPPRHSACTNDRQYTHRTLHTHFDA